MARRAIIGAGLGALLAGDFLASHHMGRSRYPTGWKPSGSIADKPHEHKREIARRNRQAERIHVRRGERAHNANAALAYGAAQNGEPYGLTRSGRKVPL